MINTIRLSAAIEMTLTGGDAEAVEKELARQILINVIAPTLRDKRDTKIKSCENHMSQGAQDAQTRTSTIVTALDDALQGEFKQAVHEAIEANSARYAPFTK